MQKRSRHVFHFILINLTSALDALVVRMLVFFPPPIRKKPENVVFEAEFVNLDLRCESWVDTLAFPLQCLVGLRT